MRFLLIFVSLSLVACNSTSHRDDYARHVNSITDNYLNEANFKFSFAANENVDLRGLYSSDDTTDSTPILYQGGAGLAGLFAQIGTHAALVKSKRNGKLAKEQEEANRAISPLIVLTKDIALSDLIGSYNSQLINLKNTTSDTVITKPIFFSNSDMTKLSLKLIVWLPSQEKDNNLNQEVRYKNMISVFNPTLNEKQRQELIKGDKDLSEVLSPLLKTALYIAKNDLTGHFSKFKRSTQTFFIDDGSGKRVVRGSIVGEECGFQIIQDIHSWFIVTPKPESIDDETNEFNVDSCP